MTRYTVVWHRLAEEELADIWNRAAVASAANSIDTAIAVNAQQKGNSVSSRSRELTIPPLQALFRVRTNDRIGGG